jgi:diguanylate cyclase (GGDEF)-like protein
VAAKLMEVIRALAMPHGHSTHGVVTVSVGIASWPAEMELDAEALIEKADKALYVAKERGRNRYAVG